LELVTAAQNTTIRQLLGRCVRAIETIREHGVDVSGSTLSIGVRLYEDQLMLNLGIEPDIMRKFSGYEISLTFSVYKTST
jgi:hypothetical protein